jgi:hypothetical protein
MGAVVNTVMNLGFHNICEVLDLLHDWRLLNEGSAPRIQSFSHNVVHISVLSHRNLMAIPSLAPSIRYELSLNHHRVGKLAEQEFCLFGEISVTPNFDSLRPTL